MDDYYKVLGVKQFATEDEIKKSFRLLAKRWHPDLNQGSDKSEEVFKKINEAYYVLSKPTLKSKYDYHLKAYISAQEEVEQDDCAQKAEKEAKVNERLNSLNKFMQKMRGLFENIIYEDEDSPTTLNKRYFQRIITKTKTRIIDLIYEEVDD